MIRSRHLLLIVGLLLATSCKGTTVNQPPQQEQLTRAVSAPERLEPAESLPEMARAILRSRMASHAHDMGDLMSAIMLLSYQRIRIGAQSIAEDASFSRPLSGDATELNSALPDKFFDYQDDLRRQAKALAVAASHTSAAEVAREYGTLAQTCVNCHAAYRAGR